MCPKRTDQKEAGSEVRTGAPTHHILQVGLQRHPKGVLILHGQASVFVRLFRAGLGF